MRRKHILRNARRFTLGRPSSSLMLACPTLTRSWASHHPPPVPPTAPSAPIPPNELFAAVLSKEAFRECKGKNHPESGSSAITTFLQAVCFEHIEAETEQLTSTSYCLAGDLFPNLAESALYLVGRNELFLKDDGRVHEENGRASPNNGHPMQQLERCVCEAAMWCRKRVAFSESNGTVAAHQTVKQFLCDTRFIRSLLEQAFLSLYYCEDRSPAPDSKKEKEPKYAALFADNVYCAYPASLRSQLEEALRVLLRQSSFSFWTMFEQNIRGAPRYPYRSALALEVFMLWWYCNADVLPVELTGNTSTRTGRLSVPNFYATQHNVVNENFEIQKDDGATTTATAATRRGEQTPLADEALDVAIDHLLLQRGDTGIMSSSPTCAIHSEGGFLHTHLLFPPAYRRTIRELAKRVPFKKYHVTCSLLPRVMQVAASLPPSARQRGISILTQLSAWCCMALCDAPTAGTAASVAAAGAATQSPAFNPFAEDPTQWVVLCCTMCAIARIEANRKALTLSVAGATQTEVLQTVQADYVKMVATICAVATGGDDALLTAASLSGAAPLDESGLMWAHKLFHVVYQCFCTCGYLDRLSVTKPLLHEKRPFLFYTLFTQVTDTFPHIFHGGATVSTLWAMCCLDNMASVPHSSVAKETALLAWKRAALAANGKQTTITNRPEQQKENGEDEATNEAFTFTAVDALEAGQQEAAVLHGQLVPSRADKRSTAPLLLATASPSSVNGGTSPPLVTVERTRAAALCLFRKHARLPVLQLNSDALRTAPLSVARFSAKDTRAVREDTMLRTVQPPSFYTWIHAMRLYAQLGDPANVTASDGRLMACLEKDIFPHCRPMMTNYLRKMGLQSLHHGGQTGVLAMVTRFSDEVDRLPPGLAWSYLLQGALWSGLPSSVDFNNTESTTSLGKSDLSCFGHGSFAWKLLEQNRKDLFLPAKGTGVSAAEMNSRSVFNFLELLTLSLPQDAKQVVFLLPHVEKMKQCLLFESDSPAAAVTQNANNNQGHGEQPAMPSEPIIVDALTEEVYTYEDAEGVGEVTDNGLGTTEDHWDDGEDALRLTEEDLTSTSTIPTEGQSSAAARVRLSPAASQKADGDEVAEDQAGKDQEVQEEAATALQQALSWSSPAAQHVLRSMLDVCYWISSIEETPTRKYAVGGYEELEVSATLCLCYEQLCSLFARQLSAEVENTRPSLLLQPFFLQKMCSILLGSCPDVYLINQCMLLLLLHYVTETRRNPTKVFNRLYGLEEPLCQLMLFHGITVSQVRAWRDRASMWSSQEQLDGGRRVLENISNQTNANHLACEKDLLFLLGSFVLFSLEQRATIPLATLSKATSNNAYEQDVLPLLRRIQTHSYHVQTFLADSTSLRQRQRQRSKSDVISPALQVILPSQQLLTDVKGRFVKSMKEVLPRHRRPHQKDAHRMRDNRDANRAQILHQLRHGFYNKSWSTNNSNTSHSLENDFHSLVLEDESATISHLFGAPK